MSKVKKKVTKKKSVVEELTIEDMDCVLETLRRMGKYEEEEIENLEVEVGDIGNALKSCRLKKMVSIGISVLRNGTIKGTEERIIVTMREMNNTGLGVLEFSLKGLGKTGENVKKAIKVNAEKYGVKVTVHAPYYINLLNDDVIIDKKGRETKVRMSDFSKEILMNCIRSAHQMGAKRVVFHVGFYGKYKYEKDLALQKVETELKEVMQRMEQEGIQDVILSPETTGKKSIFGSLDELIMIAKDLDLNKIEPAIDIAHIYARNNGKINYEEVIDKLKEASEEKRWYMHYTPVTISKKGELRHEGLSSMKPPDFNKLMQTIIDKKIKVEIINESPRNIEDAIRLKKRTERLIEDVAVQDGMRMILE